jgi:hypothetical protein
MTDVGDEGGEEDDEGCRQRGVGLVWFGDRSFAGPQDDNLAPTTCGDGG